MSQLDLNLFLSGAFEWTWKTSLSATVLIGLVLLLQMVFRKSLPPRWSYALWLLVVLRIMMPDVPGSRFSIFNLASGLKNYSPTRLESVGRSVPAEPSKLSSPNGLAARRDGLTLPAKSLHSTASGVHEGDALPNRTTSSRSEPLAGLTSPLERASSLSVPSFLTLAQWVWLIGATGYFLTILVRHGRLAFRLRRQPLSTNPRVRAFVESGRAALGLRREVRCIESNMLRTPAIFGFFKPRLLLPSAMLERLDDRELQLVILHELVHIRRRDVLLNWLLIALQSLHWFNPAVWLAFRRLRAERELVCDSVVMARLAMSDRHVYGNTLLKLLDARVALPSLVPILNHKHEIQRRITMIAQFKPTSRLVSIASALLSLTLGCFTFTGAAEKKPPTKAADKPKAESEFEKQGNTQERGLKILEEEWAKQDNLVKRKRQELDQLKVELQIMDPEEFGERPNTADLEVIRKLESTRIEAFADFKRTDTLYRHLTNLTRVEFNKAVATASPDQQLVTLFEQRALLEQKLEDLLTAYQPDHPDVKRLNSVLAKIHIQIDDRLDGILNGLKARREAEKARLDDLQAAVSKYKTSHIESAIKIRPYLEAKRDLESLQQVRERLTSRIIQAKVDSAIPFIPEHVVERDLMPTDQNQMKRAFIVLGQIQKPGVYEIARESSVNLVQAIATGGGPTDKGNLKKVTVLRPAKDKNLIFNLNAEDMATDERPLFEVLAGDIITVPAKIF